MINATQARTLAEESEAAINAVVERIGEKIKATAELGGTEIDLEAAMNYDKKFEVAHEPYRPEEMNSWQKLVAARLKREGFQVAIKQKIVKIGGGFKSMDDEPPREESRPFIQVRW
jgi:hypothetical protein